jgi:RecB family endonuclease NucS
MPQHVRLWEIDQVGEPRDLSQSRLDLESRLEEWLERDVSMLGHDLLIIGKQVPTDFGGFIDLLCIDSNGDLVVVELKRDKTPSRLLKKQLRTVISLQASKVSKVRR